MSDRFRELENPATSGRIEAVLSAAIANFEVLAFPSRTDLKQFERLFVPLFEMAGETTKRHASAALSRCRRLPEAIVLLVARQPVEISAPFLAHSPALDEAQLETLIREKGAAHARAIARRKNLTERSRACLSAIEDPVVTRSLSVRSVSKPKTDISSAERHRLAAEERLRGKLKAMVADMGDEGVGPAQRNRPSPETQHHARLKSFARAGEPLYFATCLADVLGISFRSAEAILLDISGVALAEALTAIACPRDDATMALTAFLPHLSRPVGPRDPRSRASALLSSMTGDEAARRLAERLADEVPPPARATSHPGAANTDMPGEPRIFRRA